MRTLLVWLLSCSTAFGATITLYGTTGTVQCQLSKATTVRPNGNIIAHCGEPTGPVDPPTTGCQRPTDLSSVATAPISQYNGEQNVLRRNQYYALSFTMPARIAYFGFVEVEQTNKDAARFASISECPGDFVSIPQKCWATGRTFSLYGDAGGYGGCRLEQGKRYWLNVRTADPRVSSGTASAEKRTDDTCPVGARCGFSVRATIQ